jgi:hypothetical protein
MVDLGTRQVTFVQRGRTFVPVAVQVLGGLGGTEGVVANS